MNAPCQSREELRARLLSGEKEAGVVQEFARVASTAADCALVSRSLRQLPEEVLGLATARIAILRSSTVEPLVPRLEVACLSRGLRPLVRVGPYGSIAQEILGESSWLAAEPFDVLLVWARLPDLEPGLWKGFASGFPRAVEDRTNLLLGRLEDAARAAAGRFARPVLLANMERPRQPELGIFDAQHDRGQVYATADVNRQLARLSAELPGVYVWDVASCQAEVGLGRWFDEKLDFVAGLPYTLPAQVALAESLGRMLRAFVTPPRKCLVLDLDGTLWGGILGEDGPHGVKIGQEYPGVAYRTFQQDVLSLHHRGVLLAVASKNDHADAMAVLRDHEEMVLRPEHFSAFQINWNDKTESLRAIAGELNLGTDALVFVDDNPAECARARQVLPEVLTIRAPEDPLALAGLLRSIEAFDVLTLSDEDRQRGAMYRAEKDRGLLQAKAGTLDEFYHSLRMTARIGRADAGTFARIAQLTQRTNQFNLTTLRYSEEQVAEMAGSEEHRIYWVRMEDAFGDNGLVAVAFVRPDPGGWEIDNLLMSCRVIQRTVETVLLAHVLQEARAADASRIAGEIRFSPKNEPARDFFARHGFRLREARQDGELWEADLHELDVGTPDWFTLEHQRAASPAAAS